MRWFLAALQRRVPRQLACLLEAGRIALGFRLRAIGAMRLWRQCSTTNGQYRTPKVPCCVRLSCLEDAQRLLNISGCCYLTLPKVIFWFCVFVPSTLGLATAQSRVVSCVPFQCFPNLVPERACFSLPSAATWPVSGFHRPGARRVFGPTCPEAVSKGGPLFALRLWWTSPRMRSTPTWLSARTLGKRKRGDSLGANPTGSHRFG